MTGRFLSIAMLVTLSVGWMSAFAASVTITEQNVGPAGVEEIYERIEFTVTNNTSNPIVGFLVGNNSAFAVSHPGFMPLENWNGFAPSGTLLTDIEEIIGSSHITESGYTKAFFFRSDYLDPLYGIGSGETVGVFWGTAERASSEFVAFGAEIDGSRAIHTGTTTVVPIPGAVWLFGSGLIGIVGIRKKFKK